jgi:hypothetical protein
MAMGCPTSDKRQGTWAAGLLHACRWRCNSRQGRQARTRKPETQTQRTPGHGGKLHGGHSRSPAAPCSRALSERRQAGGGSFACLPQPRQFLRAGGGVVRVEYHPLLLACSVFLCVVQPSTPHPPPWEREHMNARRTAFRIRDARYQPNELVNQSWNVTGATRAPDQGPVLW